MPKIISTQPEWLARSTPAYRLFGGTDSSQIIDQYPPSLGRSEAPGLKLLAHRGSEVFIANGKTIRWADLASMKVDWEDKHNEHHENLEDDDSLVGKQFRVLHFKYVAEPIVQIIISPNQSLLAIVTAHTVHVCLLPDPSHLSERDSGPFYPRTQMVGNTTHVLSSSRIVSALWHPFGVGGNCLVTITADAVVRVWELSLQNRSTAEEPTLAIDLRELSNATTTSDNVEPRPLGISKGISYDAVEMEVAGACFGGTGVEQDLGWSGMTLWIAMTEGDVYALSPLLPTKWQAYAETLSNLATTILAEKDQQETESEKADFLAQHQWISEQQSSPVLEAPRQDEFDKPSWIYTRPTNISAVPKLQGPFSIVPGDLQYELVLADIHVVPPRLYNEDQNTQTLGGLPVSIVCLLTQLGTVYVCAETNGLHGQWLPETSALDEESDADTSSELVVLGAVETFKESNEHSSSPSGWPTLSSDRTSLYAFYVTNSQGIWYLSAEQWIKNLESEMSLTTTAGSGFRVGIGVEGFQIQRQKLISIPERDEDQASSPLVIEDSDIGHMVLTMYQGTPLVVILDTSPATSPDGARNEPQIKNEPFSEAEERLTINAPSRTAYIPSKVFRQDLRPLKDRLRKPSEKTKLNQIAMSEHIRLSPAFLELMTHDHRVLSEETHKLGLAIAELFTRCISMQEEFKTQIEKVREIAQKVDNITEEEDDDDDKNDGNLDGSDNKNHGSKLLSRVSTARDRQAALVQRFEALKAKTRGIGRPLSDREKNWMTELDRLAGDTEVDDEGDDQGETSDGSEPASPNTSKQPKVGKYLQRCDKVQAVAKELCAEVDSLVKQKTPITDEEDHSRPTSPAGSITISLPFRGVRVPPDIRKQKMAEIEMSVERQAALLDSAEKKLERLGIEM